ncbi:trypsin-like peptidase domain-containing protein [Paenibacillus dokdonensis]|uniref:Trypsin-like peptidase domain-containing protein n=1 Tax=Paenibacillus dokdonensis TaxID=2567944 RepID=A0ABU6GHV1_9BACL|nr:trypsin-like peptidase domain-containing protein [Paenibacillus dokdonensis]MEC0238677.1 trypsin-like peptidase domain-containing protein [Paenibacillus dokdonensis]
MDERNRSGQPEDEFENDTMKRQDSSESGSSYYYSYGPFQSLGKDNAEQHGVESHNQEDVEITPPNPVRPLPTVSPYLSSTDPGNAGRNGGGTGGNGGNSNWQFNQKPKTSVKTVLISFLAGVVVISALMFTSDRMNLFTPNAAMSSAEQPSTTVSAAPESSGNGGNTSTTSLPLSKPTDVSGVVQEAGPAVVKIETLVKQSSRSSQSQTNPFSNDPFSYFFGDQSGSGSDFGDSQPNSDSQSQSQNQSKLVPYGIGSGFIYNKDGYILTNEHVVENADVIQVTIENDSKTYEAKLLGKSKDLDLAVLKIEGKNNFPVVPLGDSNSLKVGQPVVAIGNPQGFDHTVTSGVLSARERSIDIKEETGSGTRKYQHLLQTDASINPGNSGGPLLNMNGEVIGMNVAVSADSQGIGFAIPTSTIKNVVQKLETNQSIPKDPVPFIGATLMTLTDEVAKQMGTTITEGCVVAEVVFKSPAYEADLRPYDIITGVNGTSYKTNSDLVSFIQKQKVGSNVTLNVVRNGKKMDLQVTVGDKNKYNIPSESTDQE